MRPKTIVYFEWIMFGTILLNVLRAYLDDPIIGQIATDRVFNWRVEELVVVGVVLPVLIFPLTLTLFHHSPTDGLFPASLWEIGFSKRDAICFRLPMRPMPYFDTPALCDHCIAAKAAFARQPRASFSTVSINDGKFHLFSPQWPIRAQSTVR